MKGLRVPRPLALFMAIAIGWGPISVIQPYYSHFTANSEQRQLVGPEEYNGTTSKPIDRTPAVDHKLQNQSITTTTTCNSTIIKTTKPFTNQTVINLDKNLERKIAFVHVGKAAGNTLRTALPKFACHRLRGKERRAACFEQTTRPQSPLNEAAHVELHLEGGKQARLLQQNVSTFMFALRNPVTRALSAYQYLHYNNTKSVFAMMESPEKDFFYKQCFPTLTDLMESIHQASVVTDKQLSSCQELAFRVLRGTKDPIVKNINQHLYYNYEFYVNQSIRQYPCREIFVVRTESIWDDVRKLDRMLGGTGVYDQDGIVKNALPGSHNNDNNYGQSPPTSDPSDSTNTARQITSQVHQKELCCVLWKELELYQEVLLLALNLGPDEKTASIIDLMETCQIETGAPATGLSTTKGIVIKVIWSAWSTLYCPGFS